MSIPSYAYTCAVCEIEIDPETGRVEIVGYTSIDDCGRAVNPMLIHGHRAGDRSGCHWSNAFTMSAWASFCRRP